MSWALYAKEGEQRLGRWLSCEEQEWRSLDSGGRGSVLEEGVDFAKMEPRDGRIVRHVLGSF